VDRLEFIYDEAGRPLQLIFNGRIYNYVLNLQGDVQQIRRSTDGVVVATYLYNAWGQLLQSTGSMAESNPIRYRGYFYCLGSGFYYLNSRYYDPVIGRFINADAYISTGQGFLGYNMFAYCLNNPVNMVDPDGYAAGSIGGIIRLVGRLLPRGGGGAASSGARGSSIAGALIGGGIRTLPRAVPRAIPLLPPMAPLAVPNSQTEAERRTITATPPRTDDPNLIFRWGGTNPGNLTPRAVDINSGLSFSTRPGAPGTNAATTIQLINATGILVAIQDGPSHISVRPVGATVEEWHNAGPSSPWTQALRSVVIRM